MTTYTRRENARRAGIATGLPKNRVLITVHKNGDEVRFGWQESQEPIAKAMTTVPIPIPAPNVQQERNGVKRPKAGGLCAAVWVWLDAHPGVSAKEAKAVAPEHGWNPNNVACEFYAWRKFNGITAA